MVQFYWRYILWSFCRERRNIIIKNYDHVIKNKILPSGKLISDYEIMTGKNISEEEFSYIDEIGILPVVPKDQWIIPKGYIVDLNGCVRKEA